MPIRAILFDKDGTLVDFQRTWGPATDRVLKVLAAGDHAVYRKLAEVSRFVEGDRRFLADSPLIAESTPVFASLWAGVLGRPPSRAFAAEVDRLFAEAAVAHLTPIGNPRLLFTEIARRGHRLGLMTNDAEANTRAQARSLGIGHLLDFVAGYDSGFGAKPEPGPVLAFAALLDIDAHDVAVVGDTAHDLIAARAAGAMAIGVRTGLTEERDLAAHADHLIDSAQALPGWLDSRSK
jgi:phosphoglycolate phosphatase